MTAASKYSLIRWLIFFVIWACATSGSYAAGFYLSPATDYGNLLTLGLAVLIAGVLSGFLQGLLLWFFKQSGVFWFLSSVVSHVLAALAAIVIFLLVATAVFNFDDSLEWLISMLTGATIGTVIGSGQWLLLRRHTTKGGIWIITTALLWMLLMWDFTTAGLNACWGGTSPSQFGECIPVARYSVDFALIGMISSGVLGVLLGYFGATPPNLPSRPSQNNTWSKLSSSKKALLVIILVAVAVPICAIIIGVVLGTIPI